MNSTKPIKKIKVLFRLRSLEMGGVQKVILDLLKNLPKDKFEFILLTNLNQGILRNEIPNGIEYYSVTKGKEDMSSNRLLNLFQLVNRRLVLEFYKIYPKALYRKFNLLDVNIEIASSYTELSYILSSPVNSKKIGWFHTDIRFVEKKLAKKFISYMHQFDVMIFGAKQTRNVIKDYYNEEFSNNRVIYNVIDKDLIDRKSQEYEVKKSEFPLVISVARLQKRKGFDMLMRAHKRLINEGINHQIKIIGDGNFKEELDFLYKDLNLDERFQFLGTLKNPYPYVKNADVFILPSKTESYPLIIGETLCLGTPIISTDVGGINEMIDNGIDGVLIQPNEEEIYNALKEMLTNENLINSLKSNAKNSYKKFDKSIIYNQVLDVLNQLSNGK